MSDNMKPCRLCGSQGHIIIKHNKLCSHEFSTYSVVCSFCRAESRTYFFAHEAIDDWNEHNRQMRSCA